MLTSLLTLYIASGLEPNFNVNSNNLPKNNSAIVKTASLSFTNLIEKDYVPVKDPVMIAPVINAKSSIAVDLKSGEVLYEKNMHDRLAIASITKIMTMLIILEENRFDEIVTISQNAASTEGSTMHLRAGEQISVKNLLYGALINSANDAAVALAEYNAGNVSSFVEKMNKRASELGLTDTHYSNPIGLDNPNNYSSAYDLSKLSSYIYHNKFIEETAQIKNLTVTSEDGNYSHNLESTNELLDSYLKVKGLKTGKTDAAGLCFIAITENDKGNEILTIVLNSPARFEESKILIDWVFRAYNWPTNDL